MMRIRRRQRRRRAVFHSKVAPLAAKGRKCSGLVVGAHSRLRPRLRLPGGKWPATGGPPLHLQSKRGPNFTCHESEREELRSDRIGSECAGESQFHSPKCTASARLSCARPRYQDLQAADLRTAAPRICTKNGRAAPRKAAASGRESETMSRAGRQTWSGAFGASLERNRPEERKTTNQDHKRRLG